MKPLKTLSAVLLLIIVTASCEKQLMPDADMIDSIVDLNYQDLQAKASVKSALYKATGSVELIWKGADKGGDMGNKPEDLLAFLNFDAHEGNNKKAPKGEIVYQVLETDFSLHREIKAKVYGVFIDIGQEKGWVVASVVSDSKGCSGGGPGGHDSNCSSGGHDDPDGGCSDDHSSHDGGCAHDDTGEEGGCSHDDTGDEGGCSNDATGDDGHIGGQGSGSSGGGDKGNPLSGKNCRLGQIIALKMHDGATPGRNGDGITWKWFDPEAAFVPGIGNIEEWPHLCKKTIIGGNIVIHD